MQKNDSRIELGLCPKKVFHIQVTTVVEFGKKQLQINSYLHVQSRTEVQWYAFPNVTTRCHSVDKT